LNQKVKDYLMLFGVAGTVIFLDQWTKWLVRTNIEFSAQWLPEGWVWFSPYARFVNWHNSGAAFGMFQDGNLVFTILAFIVIAAIIYYYPQVEADDWTLKLAMSLQLAGATGNLIDRLMVGKVTDFISIGTFPVFNIADASITVGVIVLLLGVWYKDRQEKKRTAELQGVSAQALENNDQSSGISDQLSQTGTMSISSEQSIVASEQPKAHSEQS
jgi:signal peptidase II